MSRRVHAPYVAEILNYNVDQAGILDDTQLAAIESGAIQPDPEPDRFPALRAPYRTTFVPPPIVQAQLTAYQPGINVPAPVVVVEDSGHFSIQRAKGFVIKTSLLGVAFGLAAVAVTLIVLLGRADDGLVGLIVMGVLFGTFSGTWLWALRTETQISAGGIARRHADGLWEFVGREQKHLHEMEEKRWNRK